MTLQDSPSLHDFSEGYNPPPDPEIRKKRIRIIIGIVGLLMLVFTGIRFKQSDLAASLARKAIVTGYGVDESGTPIQVEVLVFGTDINILSDEDGFFLVDNVPVGEQSVIVAYGNIATEVDITVNPGVENSIGVVTVMRARPLTRQCID